MYSNGQRLWEVGSAEISTISRMVCAIARPAQTVAEICSVRLAPKLRTKGTATRAATAHHSATALNG